jgi:hypothetical protein
VVVAVASRSSSGKLSIVGLGDRRVCVRKGKRREGGKESVCVRKQKRKGESVCVISPGFTSRERKSLIWMDIELHVPFPIIHQDDSLAGCGKQGAGKLFRVRRETRTHIK